MSTTEIQAQIESLRALEELIEEAKAEAETLRDTIKQEMLNRDVEELSAGQYIVRWTSVLSQRFDTTAFKKVMPEVYKAYTTQGSSRRFTISASKKPLARAATLTGETQEKLTTVNQGHAYYKSLPLQNQGGFYERAFHLQPGSRLPQQDL